MLFHAVKLIDSDWLFIKYDLSKSLFSDYATFKYNAILGQVIMKHFMCTHTFHSEDAKKIFFKALFGKKSGLV